MAEKKPMEKKPIRDLLTEKDAFLTTSEKMQEYFLRHTKGVIAVVAAVALIVIGAALYLNHQDKAEQAAALAYEDSLAKLAGSDDEGLAALEKVRVDYAGRKASRLASFRLLSIYVGKKDVDKALPLAEELLRTIKSAETALKPVLLINLGGLYEEKKDYQQAAKSYETLLAMSHLGPNLQRELLISLGRVYTAADRKDDAIKNYERILNEYPQTLQAFMANAMLAELKGVPVAFPLPADDMLSASGAATSAGAEEPDAVTASAVESGGVGDDAAVVSEVTTNDETISPVDEAAQDQINAEVDVEEGAPLPPNGAPAEEQTTDKAAAESGAE